MIQNIDPAPYLFIGPNPTVDAIVIRYTPGPQVLLIKRSEKARAEPGKWALPGGFQNTASKKGDLWRPGAETPREACLRELSEETKLDLRAEGVRLHEVGVYEGNQRDPRDHEGAWSRSTAFLMVLSAEQAERAIQGGDDASEARWFDIEHGVLPGLPVLVMSGELAFDHGRILSDALELLGGIARPVGALR